MLKFIENKLVQWFFKNYEPTAEDKTTALLLGVGLFVAPQYIFLYGYNSEETLAYYMAFQMVTYAVVAFLFRAKKIVFGKLLFLTNFTAATFLLSSAISDIRELNAFYIIAIGIGYLCASKNEKYIPIYAIIICLLSFAISELFEFNQIELSEATYIALRASLYPLAFIITGLIFRFYKKNNDALLTELALKSKKLESTNAQLEDFTYIASHDLKTPIRGIHHYAQFLQDDYKAETPEEGQKMIEGIKRLSNKMDELVNDVLSFSKAEKIDLEFEKFSIQDTIEGLKSDIEEQPDIEITISHNNLPNMEADIMGLKEAFLNFITNAYKYNDSEHKKIDFTFHSDSKELRISDNGIGIAKENYDKVFAFFKRVHGKEEYEGGTGA